MLSVHRSLIGLALLAALLGCAGEHDTVSPIAEDERIVEGDGTVQFISIEGGCWIIAPDVGGQLEPLNLPADFKEDRLRVHFRAERTRDVLTICQVGSIVRLLEIERL